MSYTKVALVDLAQDVAENIAGPVADDVDRKARFPQEALDGFRERKMLTALIPEELGGGGATMGEVAEAVRILAQHCSAAALAFGMHSIEINNLVHHGKTEALLDFARSLPESQLFFANANSEVGSGGDTSKSFCAVEPVDGGFRMVKDALAISYGANADVICAIGRRSPDAEPGDQSLVIGRKFELEQISDWDATGLRGTGSIGYRLTIDVEPDLVYPMPFAEIGAASGMQGHLLFLGAAWVGMAEAAAAKAHAFCRAAARKQIGQLPPSAVRVSELAIELDAIRGLLSRAIALIDRVDGTEEFSSLQTLASLRNLKIGASRGAVDVVRDALEICGISGYLREGPYSLDRILRDVHGGIVMVSNERHLYNNAGSVVLRKAL